MDSNFCAFWLAPVTQNILGYSLFCKRKEKWRVISRKFQKKKLKQLAFFYPSDLVNTKTTIPLRVGEERGIYSSMLRVSVYIHHYSPPLRGKVVYYSNNYILPKMCFPNRQVVITRWSTDGWILDNALNYMTVILTFLKITTKTNLQCNSQ